VSISTLTGLLSALCRSSSVITKEILDSNILDSTVQSGNLLLPVYLDRTPIQLQVAASASSAETTVPRTKRKYEKKFIREYKCTECDFLTNSVRALSFLLRI
jgi:hypothetical protein